MGLGQCFERDKKQEPLEKRKGSRSFDRNMLRELKSLSLNHIIKVNKSTESKGLNFMNKIEIPHS